MEDPSGGEALASVSVWDSEEDAVEYSSALMEYFQEITGAEEWVEQESMDSGVAHRATVDGVLVDVRSEAATVRLAVANDLEAIDAIVAAIVEVMGEDEVATSTTATSTAP